jgi:tripeptidyl-peptidase-1
MSILYLTIRRYHIPAKIQEHVDYITPGIRLDGGRWGGKKELKKRAMGTSKSKRTVRPPHTPPRPLPMTLESLMESIQAAPLARCDSVITPECVTGITSHHPPRDAR